MWAGLVAYAYYLTRLWSHGSFGVGELLLLALLSFFCLLPTMRWFQIGMPHLPLGEGFAFMHLIYYVIPCLGAHEGLADFSAGLRLKAEAGLILYLAALNLVYWWATRRRRGAFNQTHLMRREVSVIAIWSLLGLWLMISVALQFGLMPNFGSLRNVFRAFLGALGSIAVVCLFYRCGKGIYGLFPLALAVSGLAIGVGATFVSGSLISGACILGAALLAYTLGSKRVPVVAIVVVLLLLGFLQAGKGGYRNALLNEKTGYVETPTSFYAAYNLWFRVSWLALTRPDNEGKGEQNIFERASLVQVFTVAMDTVPHKLPYMFGETYGMIPELLVPRFFWPDKMRGTWPTECMGVYIGIQTEVGTDTTGIAVGPPAEGWLNFGWAGLVLEGVLFGVFFGWPASLTRRLEPHNIGWLMCCVFLVACVDMEHSFPEMFCSTLGGFMVGFVMLLSISTKPKLRRKIKPSGLSINAPSDSSLT